MLGSLGMPELLVIFVIALVIFGPAKLPELGRSLGRSIAEFKGAMHEMQSSLNHEVRVDQPQKGPDVTTMATADANPAAKVS